MRAHPRASSSPWFIFTMLVLLFFLVAVVSSSPAGTIGENVDKVIDELGRKIAESQVRPWIDHGFLVGGNNQQMG